MLNEIILNVSRLKFLHFDKREKVSEMLSLIRINNLYSAIKGAGEWLSFI
jgi:hypothetical protein